jgi:hypothetical protein
MNAFSYILILIVTQGLGSLETETVRFADEKACLSALDQLVKGGGQATYASSDRRIMRLLDGSVKITGYCVSSGSSVPVPE